MLFPEGTRSRDGHLQHFKSGAFRLAKETKTDLLPIAIKGTFHAIKKGGFTVHRNKSMTVTVLDPIPFDSFNDLDPKHISSLVHDLIMNC